MPNRNSEVCPTFFAYVGFFFKKKCMFEINKMRYIERDSLFEDLFKTGKY